MWVVSSNWENVATNNSGGSKPYLLAVQKWIVMAYNKEANRRYFEKNRHKRLAENKARTQSIKNWVNSYKETHPCACGEYEVCCLDFHHRNPEEKVIEVANAVRWGWSVHRIAEEIAKCDLLCANCHRKLHHSGRLI